MIHQNLSKLRDAIEEIARRSNRDPAEIQLVAVSKRFPLAAMEEALEAGQVIFGENYIQEAAEKKSALRDRIRLHFIGNLQSNKAKIAVETCDMVETIDRPKIVQALHKQLVSQDRHLDVLVQVNVGEDSHKSGVLPHEAESLLQVYKGFSQTAAVRLDDHAPLHP